MENPGGYWQKKKKKQDKRRNMEETRAGEAKVRVYTAEEREDMRLPYYTRKNGIPIRFYGKNWQHKPPLRFIWIATRTFNEHRSYGWDEKEECWFHAVWIPDEGETFKGEVVGITRKILIPRDALETPGGVPYGIEEGWYYSRIDQCRTYWENDKLEWKRNKSWSSKMEEKGWTLTAPNEWKHEERIKRNTPNCRGIKIQDVIDHRELLQLPEIDENQDLANAIIEETVNGKVEWEKIKEEMDRDLRLEQATIEAKFWVKWGRH